MSDEEPKTKRGGISKYHVSLLTPARKAAATGMTEAEIAEFLGIDRSTLWVWKTQYPEFEQALRLGKELPDERVKAALYNSAIGYFVTIKKGAVDKKSGELVEWEETQYIKPEVTAQIFFLKNRRPKEWNDRGGLGDDDFENYSDADLAKLVREKAKKLIVSKAADKVLEGAVVAEKPIKDVTPRKD